MSGHVKTSSVHQNTLRPQRVKFISEMRDWLKCYREQVWENLQQEQAVQKRWYDQQARFCQLQPGQKGIILLPTSTNKLLAKWLGPYNVVRRWDQ